MKNDIEYLPKITDEQFKDTFVQPPKKHSLDIVVPELNFSGHVFFNSLSEIIPVFDDLNLNPQYLLLDDQFKTTTEFQLKQVLTAFEHNVSMEILLGAQLVIDHKLAKDFYTAIQFYQIYYYCSELDLEKLNSAKSAKTPLIQLGSSYFNDPAHYKPKYSSEALELIFKAPFKKHCFTATYAPLAQDIQITFDTTNELNVIFSNPDFVFDGYLLDSKFYSKTKTEFFSFVDRIAYLDDVKKAKVKRAKNLPKTDIKDENHFIQLFDINQTGKKHVIYVVVENLFNLSSIIRFDTFAELKELIKKHSLILSCDCLDDEIDITSLGNLETILDLHDNQNYDYKMIKQFNQLICEDLCSDFKGAIDFHNEYFYCNETDADKIRDSFLKDLDLIHFGKVYYLNK